MAILTLIYLVVVAGLFAFIHKLSRSASGRDASTGDYALYAWSAGYVMYAVCVPFALKDFFAPLNGTVIGSDLLLRAAFWHGIPTMISSCVCYFAWKDTLPSIALALAGVGIMLVDWFDPPLPVKYIMFPLIWNAAYMGACLHVASKMRRSGDRARAAQCHTCGYPREGLAPDAPCPECGLA